MSLIIRTPKARNRVYEVDDERVFHRAMDKVPGATVEVWIQGKYSRKGKWHDLELFWSGRYSKDHPVPDQATVVAVGLRADAWGARYVVRNDPLA